LMGLAALPAGWLLKLALAETFRRPQTRLVPPLSSRARQRVAVGFLIAAIVLGIGLDVRPWWLVAPGVWLGVLGLDMYGVVRMNQRGGCAPEGQAGRAASWRYFGPALVGTVVLALALYLGVESRG